MIREVTELKAFNERAAGGAWKRPRRAADPVALAFICGLEPQMETFHQHIKLERLLIKTDT